MEANNTWFNNIYDRKNDYNKFKQSDKWVGD